MRFQRSFGLLGWFWAWCACSGIFSLLTERHPSLLSIVNVIVPALLVAYQAFSRYFIYWDLDCNGIHESWFGRKKERLPAWDKVLVVRNFVPGMRWDGTVSIYFDDPASRLGFSYFVTTPQHRRVFIETMHRFAPQATFTV
jgi:hypothetical protein